MSIANLEDELLLFDKGYYFDKRIFDIITIKDKGLRGNITKLKNNVE